MRRSGIFSGDLVLRVGLFMLLVAAGARAETATEIVRKSDLKMRGVTSYTEMAMEIVRPTWTRSMTMKAWSKGADYSLVLVTAPARDKGASSLKRGREMWNWVPSIERVIKIASSMLGQSWMGSDFTNDDLINQSSVVVDYTHAILREEPFEGTPCWVVVATPKPDAPVVWGKLVLWISKGEYNQRKVEYYDEFGEPMNTLTTHDVKELGGRQLPTRLEMRPADEPGHETVIVYRVARFDFDLPTGFFSQKSMRELRP